MWLIRSKILFNSLGNFFFLFLQFITEVIFEKKQEFNLYIIFFINIYNFLNFN